MILRISKRRSNNIVTDYIQTYKTRYFSIMPSIMLRFTPRYGCTYTSIFKRRWNMFRRQEKILSREEERSSKNPQWILTVK
mmetsp:Transcript_4737/g.6239  ORF Transcript_4737/g.6239 Transcript_4737/m.6239 type:complete len:81 (-) Transcript_4737:37-279(-)